MAETERWLGVVGLEDRFEVSDQGRVRSLNFKGSWNRVLTPSIHRYGHRKITLTVEPRRVKTFAVARLMLEAFTRPALPGEEARHLDDDPTNNVLSNLAWGTHEQNVEDRRRNKTHCNRGHRLEGKNLVANVAHKRCRSCSLGRSRLQWRTGTLQELSDVAYAEIMGAKPTQPQEAH